MATAFARLVMPKRVTFPSWVGGFLAVGHSGRVQARSVSRSGRVWTEDYGPLKLSDPDVRKFLALCHQYFHQRTLLTVAHVGLRDKLGAGGGTPVVVASPAQTGPTIATTGWSPSTLVLKAGDVVKFAGLPWVYDVTADVTSGSGAGAATIPVSPEVYVAPTPSGAVTYNVTLGAVQFQVVLEDVVQGQAAADALLLGFGLSFRETG
jgi:hypothetical protein